MRYKISLPLRVPVSKSSDFILNLNRYRNAHYQTLNKAKVNFELEVLPLLEGLPKLNKISVTYIYFAGNKRYSDLNNVCPIVGKFFEDTLVNGGYLPDDNPQYITRTTYLFGGLDRVNPRVDVIIRER